MSVLVCAGCTARYAVGAERCPQCGVNDPREEHEQRLNIPAVTVICPGRECPAYGIKRRVMLRTAAPGVLERPALHCASCGRCVEDVTDQPQQQNTEDTVPKTTVHTGASHEAAERLADDGAVERPEYLEQPERADEGGEDVSPGTSSSTSSEKQPTSPKTNDSEDRSPAPKTASRSSKGRTAASTARSTTGDQTAPAASDGDKG